MAGSGRGWGFGSGAGSGSGAGAGIGSGRGFRAGRPRPSFFQRLTRYYLWFTGAFAALVLMLGVAERVGMSKAHIGYVFLFATIAIYAAVGVMCRTSDVTEYYVAGRRVPALFNGMACAADWMSAASFLGLAGTLYLSGFDGLAFILGWTGGYCLVAFLLAPYLRRHGKFTIPEFLADRYGGQAVRVVAVGALLLCSFVYVVAQIYGVGLIASRLTGVEFGIGVFLGLAGILVCSFLGGMRAVTWTQVAQFIVLIIAYLIPVVYLSIQNTGVPIPQAVYGKVLERVTAREHELETDPREIEVRALYAERAVALERAVRELPASWEEGHAALQKRLEGLRAGVVPLREIKAAEKALADYPRTPDAARQKWTAQAEAARAQAAPPLPHATPFPGADEAARSTKRWNFLALMFCLMVGTAALPHILVRFYTTPSVSESRHSVFWALVFIFLLYFTAPALAVLVKYHIYHVLVGSDFASLPAWVTAWSKVDPGLLSITDVNRDGILQLAEITLSGDIIVLATPEIAGLPYVISGLVAAGGLAAALSTADGLLLSITAALSHDVYHKMMAPAATAQQRVTLSKILLLVIALLAAWATSLKPGDILFLVGAAFSLAASAFFPALVLGVFWLRGNRAGAVAGMLVGLGVCGYYLVRTHPYFVGHLRLEPMARWFGIDPISAGVFGVPAGFLTIIVVSLLTRAPSLERRRIAEGLRAPPAPRTARVNPA